MHEDLKELYFQDWRETETPWERWEIRAVGGSWTGLLSHPVWASDYEYRRKRKTVLINNIECSAPMRTTPTKGTDYWTINISEPLQFKWYNHDYDFTQLSQGLLWTTKEEAMAAREAISSTLQEYIKKHEIRTIK